MNGFESGMDVAFYTKRGWRILPPSIARCSKCDKPLLCSDGADFYYCQACCAQQAKAAEKKPESRIPELLLQHYCMLNDVCPTEGCFNPLLRAPDKTFVVCGVCGYKAQYRAKADDLQQQQPTDAIVRQIKDKTERYLEQMRNGQFDDPDEPSDEPSDGGEQQSHAKALMRKVHELIDSLVSEQSQQQIETLADNILRIQQIIKNLNEP